jgi:hypothetical protein
MAKRTSPKESIEDSIDAQIGNKPRKGKAPEYTPSYKMVGESKIPVSKFEGSLWENRMKVGLKVTEKSRDCWQEALKYYNHDQMAHRVASDGGHSGNIVGTNQLNSRHTETENIVFSNVTTLVPVVYAKNPEATVTTGSEANKPLCKVQERLINVLVTQKLSPGVGLKMKAKRAVALTELTNNGWIKLNWTAKQDSSPEVLKEYQGYIDKIAEAKSTKEIEKYEQHMAALEEKVAFATPGGMGLKVCSPFNIIVDPTSTEVDPADDANWMIELDYLPTPYLNCVYGEEDGDSGRYKLIYKPTHMMKSSGGNEDATSLINNFTAIGEKEMDWSAMGFSNQEAYERSCFTEVAYVWDKIKKRLLMYATADWSWPIWVWDDPLKLDRFYPYYRLAVYQNPLGGTTKGEVTYYLDQQDAINEINDEQRRARLWMKRNVLFNKNKVKQEDVDAYLKGVDETARGVDLQDGESWENVVWTMPTPGFKFNDVFMQQKEDKLQAINRIGSMSDVLSGTQFKTNTTNQAIESYQKGASIRTDERIDILEDFLSDIMWGMLQLCMMNYSPEEVADILDDPEAATLWKQTSDPTELRKYQVRVVGGSTTKPTSAAKKEEAVKVAQSLGQFANAAPMVVMKMLEVLADAFDNLVMTDQEWDKLEQSIIQQQQNQVGGAPQQDGAPQGAGGEPTQGGSGLPPEIEQQMKQLPPPVQQAIADSISKGVDPKTAVQEVLARLKGNNSQPQ